MTKSENKIYQLSRSPGLSGLSQEIYPNLALGFQDLLPLVLDILAHPEGLT